MVESRTRSRQVGESIVDRDRENKTLKLSQPAYIEKVLNKFFLDQENPTNTPIKESLQLLAND